VFVGEVVIPCVSRRVPVCSEIEDLISFVHNHLLHVACSILDLSPSRLRLPLELTCHLEEELILNGFPTIAETVSTSVYLAMFHTKQQLIIISHVQTTASQVTSTDTRSWMQRLVSSQANFHDRTSSVSPVSRNNVNLPSEYSTETSSLRCLICI
jgi:hypothetical protein